MEVSDIKKMLVDKNLKISEAEKLIGLPKTLLSRILSGKRTMNYRHRHKIGLFMQTGGVEIFLPTGEKTISEDRAIIEFFDLVKRGIFKITDTCQKDEKTQRWEITEEVSKAIWDSLPPKMMDRRKQALFLSKRIHYENTGEIKDNEDF